MTRSTTHRAPLWVSSLAAGFVLCESARRASTHTAGDLEVRCFRRVNQAPDQLHLPVWAVMQSGSLAAAFATGGLLVRAGRPRPALAATLAGVAVWGGVKLVKPFVGRGRPADVIDGVQVRGQAQSGLGYPSGHAAVAATLAAVTVPAAAAVQQIAAVTAGGIVGGTRMYVGAHLPLDVAGGVAIGMLCGSAARGIMVRSP